MGIVCAEGSAGLGDVRRAGREFREIQQQENFFAAELVRVKSSLRDEHVNVPLSGGTVLGT